MASALSKVLTAVPIPQKTWVEVIGCSERQFHDWWTGRRELPRSVAHVIAKATGVQPEALSGPAKAIEADAILPPLWLKARQSALGEAEHRAIIGARLLAARYDEIAALLKPPATSPRLFLAEMKQAVDPQDPARLQGAVAAEAFLGLSTLGKTAVGIGEVVRGFLRARGILVLETPINARRFEGFCVPVGRDAGIRPCLLANSYRTTWFRRNYVLLHELAHAAFDLEAESAVFDLATTQKGPLDIAEQRADAFAMHALVPKRLLVAMENRGLRLATLDAAGLARLVAATHAEAGLIVRAAKEYDLIAEADAQRLTSLRIARDLRAISLHARGLGSVPVDALVYPEVRDWGARLTTFPLPGFRLPIPFVRAVLEAVAEHTISRSKAAELLMIGEDDLARFGLELEREDVLAS